MNKKLSVFLGLFLVLCTFISVSATLPADANVIASWNFNEGTGTNALDNKTQLYNGTLQGGLGWTTVGKNSNAINNSGVAGRYVTVADNDTFSFTDGAGTDKPFSICYWVNHSTLTDYQTVVNKWNNSGGSGGEYYDLFFANGMVLWSLTDPSGSGFKIGRTAPAGTAVANKWEYYCFTYDGSESVTGIKIYKNASVVDNSNDVSGTYTGMTNGVRPVQIGTRTGIDGLRGTIDEVVFFNYSLSSDEITDLYYSGAGKFFPFNEATKYNYSIKIQVNYNGVGVDASKLQITNNDTNTSVFNATNSSGGLWYYLGFNTVIPPPNVYYIVTAWINGNNTVRPISHVVYVNASD